jgi:glutamate-1-semialdehyde 2,1-aminomutase
MIETGRSAELFERARRVLPAGNTRTTLYVEPAPVYAVRGEGCRVVDADGRSLIDLQNNYTALIHGHAHPAIAEAATAAIADGASFGVSTEWEIELAERLTDRIAALERVRFNNSGSEAVMMAVRGARAFTGRDAVLRFEGCYHGTSDAAIAADAPGLPAAAAADLVTVPYGDREAFDRAVAEHARRLACVVIDLMPNRAGLVPADQAFAEAVARGAREVGALVLVDEVITFRLRRGGLQQDFDIAPDLVTLGKVIGGGFPVGAFGGRAEVMDVFDPGRARHVGHGGTFNANPVTMRAGAAALDLLDAGEIDRINALGDRLRAELTGLGYRVNGSGSLLRVLDAGEREVWWKLVDAGVLTATNGLCSISTAMDDATIDELVEVFGGVR